MAHKPSRPQMRLARLARLLSSANELPQSDVGWSILASQAPPLRFADLPTPDALATVQQELADILSEVAGLLDILASPNLPAASRQIVQAHLTAAQISLKLADAAVQAAITYLPED